VLCLTFSFFFVLIEESTTSPTRRGRLRQTDLELYKLSRSEWDMPHQVCTRIDPVSLSENQNELSIISQIKILVSYLIDVTDLSSLLKCHLLSQLE
jgi:hypothetical protein